MIEGLEDLVYWHWLAFGTGLLVAEVLLPGSFLMWFGIAALVTGGLLWLVPGLAATVQLAVFAVLSVSAIVAWRRYERLYPAVSDHPDLNRRGQQYVGRSYTLADGLVNGRGKLRVDDGAWAVRCQEGDLPAGTTVRVAGVEGTVLVIERAS